MPRKKGTARAVPGEVSEATVKVDLEKYRETAVELGASEAIAVPSSWVTVDERVRLKCAIPPCPNYGRCGFCPPHTPEPEFMRKALGRFEWAVFFKNDVPAEDAADVRRHLATVNSHWGNETSVLLGDFLFTKAFCLAISLENNFASRAIGKATQVVCEGELRQIGNRGNFDLSEDEYLRIIGAKTAELYSCCGRLGAHFAGAAAETVEAMGEFGQCLGIAFQIADDMLDLLGDEEVTGKSLGTDLDQQKPTLPLIHVLQKAAPADRERILALMDLPAEGRREALNEWFDRFDAFDYTREKARQFGRRAGQLAQSLPDGPARQSLVELADFVVHRVR